MDDAHKHGFNAPGGDWCWRRNADGSVTVYAPEPGEVTYSAQRWASVVAAVSQHGEGHDSYHSALRFHGTELHQPEEGNHAA